MNLTITFLHQATYSFYSADLSIVFTYYTCCLNLLRAASKFVLWSACVTPYIRNNTFETIQYFVHVFLKIFKAEVMLIGSLLKDNLPIGVMNVIKRADAFDNLTQELASKYSGTN